MNIKKVSYSDEGFSLIEILITVLILSIGLLAIGKMQIGALSGTDLSGQILEATYIAQSKMDTLLCLDYDDPQLSVNATNSTIVKAASGTEYTVNPPIIDVNYPINNTKTITLKVSWQNGRHHITIQDIISNNI